MIEIYLSKAKFLHLQFIKQNDTSIIYTCGDGEIGRRTTLRW